MGETTTKWDWFVAVLDKITEEEIAMIPRPVIAYMRREPAPSEENNVQPFAELSPYEQIDIAGFSVAKLYHDIISRRKGLSRSTFIFPVLRYRNHDNSDGVDPKTQWPYPSEQSAGWVCEVLPGKLYYGPSPRYCGYFSITRAHVFTERIVQNGIESYGVTDILSLLGEGGDHDEQSTLTVHGIRMDDFYRDEPRYHTKLLRALDKLHSLLEDPDKVVYVHCNFGLHRSPAVVFGYLIRQRGMSVADARRMMNQKRPTTRILSYFELFETWDTTRTPHRDVISHSRYHEARRCGRVETNKTYFDYFETLLDALPELREFCGPFASRRYDVWFYLTKIAKEEICARPNCYEGTLLRKAPDFTPEFLKDLYANKVEQCLPKCEGEDANDIPDDAVLSRIVELWSQIDELLL